MHFLVKFVIRGLASLFFLCIVFVVIIIFAKIYQLSAGPDVTVEQVALIFTMVFMTVEPGVLVLCVVRGDSRWNRWRAMLLIQLPLAVVAFIWMRAFESSFWANNYYQTGESAAILGMVNGLVFGGLMFLSGFLTAGSLPSLKRRAVGRPPRLMWLSVALFLAPLLPSFLVLASDMPLQAEFSASGEALESLDLVFFNIFLESGIGISFAFEVVLVLLVALRGSLLARALLVAYFINYILQAATLAPGEGGGISVSTLAWLVALASRGVALALLYTPEVNRWLTDEKPGRTAAARYAKSA